PQETMKRALERLRDLMACRWAALVMAPEPGGEHIVVTSERAPHCCTPDNGVQVDHLIPDWREQRSHVVRDLAVQKNLLPVERVWLEEGVRSYLAYALVYGEERIGTLIIAASSALTFVQDQSYVLAEIADVADKLAIGMQHARMNDQLRRYAAELERTVNARTVELRRTREQVETMLDNSPDAILLVDPTGEIESCNHVAFGLLRLSGSEALLNHTFQTLLGAGNGAVVESFLHSAASEGLPKRLQLMVERDDGTHFDADLTLAPLVSDGQPARLVCNIRDISALKAAERLKDAFVSNVSHEIRTPITAIRLNADLITLNPESAEVYLGRLKRDTDRLAHIVDYLLQLSQFDQEQVRLAMRPINLDALCDEAVADRQPLAQSRQHTLRYVACPGLPPAGGDSTLLSQVLDIFLNNACNYTPPGGEIVVRAAQRPVDGRLMIGVQVQDNGPGVPLEEQGRVFDRFFRGSVGVQSGMPGTGIGLALAKQIIGLHGGIVECGNRGASDSGAIFSFWVPAQPTSGRSNLSPVAHTHSLMDPAASQ
ncbi:MAG: PAS domain S-box protein, partial [Anaerolineae bacterium]|nr:PAS domain S-box protein [Anaerolineae bacterium]